VSKPLGIHIGEVSLKDGSAHFADFSLTPDFATAIQQLNGRIGSLDTRQTKPTSVDIQGKVDRYAPMSIQGTLNPFDPLDSLDITTRFENVELTTLTPYSGKFAGYRIRQGRLNLELIYRIENGQLNAQNTILLDNLQLGERVDSPSAVDLPIRLAVALLKDSQGRIALALPVSGDLNNPQFSVLPIVWQTLRNLLVRTAQAPFKFIGNLVSGGAQVDLSSVQFAGASEQLDAQAQGALDLLAKALQERPALRLEVEGRSAQSSDGPLLAEQRLHREYQRILYKILQRRGDEVPAEAGQLQVPEDDKASLLEALYRRFLQQQPPAAWTELAKDERSDKLRHALLETWSQSPLMLRKLAQSRAASIKDYLVDQGELQDQRIYLLDTSIGQAESSGQVATQLYLGSK
jgi:outer membrane protein OmpA-like peptidoglycan-associated protein